MSTQRPINAADAAKRAARAPGDQAETLRRAAAGAPPAAPAPQDPAPTHAQGPRDATARPQSPRHARHAAPARSTERRAGSPGTAGETDPRPSGARIAHRAPAQPGAAGVRPLGEGRRPQAPRRTSRAVPLIGAAIGIGLAILVLVLVGRALVGVALYDDRTAAATEPQTEEVDAAAVDAQGTIAFLGSVYSIGTDEDGQPALCYQADGSATPLASFTIVGDPVGLALYGGRFYTVANTDDGYLVQVFVPGDGSLPADYASGAGAVEAIALDGGRLQLTFSDGTATGIDLLEV